MKSLITLIASLALCATLFALNGCNTTKGFGKDVESAGAGIKNSADKNGAD